MVVIEGLVGSDISLDERENRRSTELLSGELGNELDASISNERDASSTE